MSYPNYRNTVEVVIVHQGKVLVAKRSEQVKIAPGVWNVPAGKVKYEETPIEAVYREALEETNLQVEDVKEIAVRTFNGKNVDGEQYYRCIFTYLAKPLHNDIQTLQMNDEHSIYTWVTVDELTQTPYETFDPYLQKIIRELV